MGVNKMSMGIVIFSTKVSDLRRDLTTAYRIRYARGYNEELR